MAAVPMVGVEAPAPAAADEPPQPPVAQEVAVSLDDQILQRFQAFWETVTAAIWAKFNENSEAQASAQQWFRSVLTEMLDGDTLAGIHNIGDLTVSLCDSVDHGLSCELHVRVCIIHKVPYRWDVDS